MAWLFIIIGLAIEYRNGKLVKKNECSHTHSHYLSLFRIAKRAPLRVRKNVMEMSSMFNVLAADPVKLRMIFLLLLVAVIILLARKHGFFFFFFYRLLTKYVKQSKKIPEHQSCHAVDACHDWFSKSRVFSTNDRPTIDRSFLFLFRIIATKMPKIRVSSFLVQIFYQLLMTHMSESRYAIFRMANQL